MANHQKRTKDIPRGVSLSFLAYGHGCNQKNARRTPAATLRPIHQKQNDTIASFPVVVDFAPNPIYEVAFFWRRVMWGTTAVSCSNFVQDR